MLNVFKNEIYKSLTKGKILAYLIFLTLIISVIGVIIKINILYLTIEDGLIQFLKYNLTFILMKILTPILLIIVTASVIADDYSSGVMKFFLISKIDKKDVILGKILYLIIITLINTLVMFIIFSIVGGILAGDFSNIFLGEYIKVMNAYIITAFAFIKTHIRKRTDHRFISGEMYKQIIAQTTCHQPLGMLIARLYKSSLNCSFMP